MHHKRSTFLQQLPSWKQAGAACLVVLYLLVGTPLWAGLTALAGTADRSHHVAVRETGGNIQVVLQHDGSGATMHRHGLVARALTLAAKRAGSGHPDHVIQFPASSTVQSPGTLAGICSPEASITPILSSTGFYRELPGLLALRTVPPPPPPEVTPFPLSLSSTLLLI